MLVLLMFVAGCGPVPWKDFYQSHAENIIGLECVYYRNGRLTFKFDEKYAKTDDDGYRDFIGLIRNGNQQDKAQVSACVITGEDVIFPEGKAVFDSTGLTISFNAENIEKEITFLLIGYGDWRYGIDFREQNYVEPYNIAPAKVEKYGYHVYCPDYLFDEDERKNKCIVDCIKSNGRFQYTDIFIYDYQYFAPDNTVTVYAHGYANGAVVESLNYHANSTVLRGDYPRFYRDPVAYESDPVLDPDTSDLIDPERIIPEVIMHIRHRESGVYWGSRYPFCGVCLLKYDVSSDYLYYEFMFDGRASLYVDAHTGEISDTLMV